MNTQVSTRAFVEQVMGLPVSIHVRAHDPRRDDIADAVANAFAHLRKVDAVFSAWRDESELLRLRRGDLTIANAHPWMSEVVDLCAEAERRTEGLFTATLPLPGGDAAFDPTGLVKGWAVAGAAAHLQVVPQISFCVNAGGDLTVGQGRGEIGESTWRVGIQDPADDQMIARVVPVTSGALATSGTSARGAHIVDPRTGERLARVGSATVIGPDLLWADVWATAVFVDPQRGTELLQQHQPGYQVILL